MNSAFNNHPDAQPFSTSPGGHGRRILFAILGTSPQILTETIYALTHGTPAFVPDEIHVLTTGIGAVQCKRGLFVANGGGFYQLKKAYDLPDIDFSPDHIQTTLRDDGSVIDDIRSPEDNQAVANHITRLIKSFTSEPETSLHVSIAGGRKTMGFYAGYALSMFGRHQDQLSHVLVQAEFEGEPEFYFPTPVSEVFSSKHSKGTYLDKQDAYVELALLPFVRMRDALDDRYLENIECFDDMVNVLQKELSHVKTSVRLMPSEQAVYVGETPIPLTQTNFIFYYWAAKKRLQNEPIFYDYQVGDAVSLRQSNEFYSILDELYAEGSDAYITACEKWDDRFINGMKSRFITDRRNEIKEAFSARLGVNADAFLIDKCPRQKAVCLTIKPEQIQMEPR
ncbi:MAG: CRISPR-associated ring nuclease Csm6 [Hydrogenovibrio sp.]